MIKRIVVPVDFSDVSNRAARYVLEELAPQLKADVALVTVLEASDLRVAIGQGLHGFETDEDVHRMVKEWVDANFAKIDTPADGVKTTRDIRRGIPERSVIEAIREHQADLVVMGAHGFGKRTPLGSKAEYVLGNAGVPLMLIT